MTNDTATILRLSGASETLLIPLAARTAGQTMFPELAFVDPAASALLERMGVDLSRYRARVDALHGCLTRCQWFDREVATFLRDHPDAQVVSLGSGLDTRFERIAATCGGDGWRWIDTDLAAVTELRERFLDKDPRRVNRVLDATDPAWLDQLDLDTGRSVLFLAEGLLMYLPPEAVRGLLVPPAELWADGAECRFVFDWLSPLLRRGSRRVAAIEQTADASVRFRSSLRGRRDIERMHPRWRISSYTNERACVTPRSRAINRTYRFLTGHDLVGWTSVTRI